MRCLLKITGLKLRNTTYFWVILVMSKYLYISTKAETRTKRVIFAHFKQDSRKLIKCIVFCFGIRSMASLVLLKQWLKRDVQCMAIAYAELQIIKPIEIQTIRNRIFCEKGKFVTWNLVHNYVQQRH